MNAPIEEIIPHRAPMRWIDTLIECTEMNASASTTFSADHYAVADGAVLEVALIECVAQTTAAALGQLARNNGQTDGIRGGMLVAVSNFKIHSRPSPGKLLKIEGRVRKRLGPMLMVAATISCDGVVVAAGDMTMYA